MWSLTGYWSHKLWHHYFLLFMMLTFCLIKWKNKVHLQYKCCRKQISIIKVRVLMDPSEFCRWNQEVLDPGPHNPNLQRIQCHVNEKSPDRLYGDRISDQLQGEILLSVLFDCRISWYEVTVICQCTCLNAAKNSCPVCLVVTGSSLVCRVIDSWCQHVVTKLDLDGFFLGHWYIFRFPPLVQTTFTPKMDHTVH